MIKKNRLFVMNPKNIFDNLPAEIPEEIFEPIISVPNITIERIISREHASPADFWYDQERNEWVMVLQGQARLVLFEGEQRVDLKVGDYINIPAHCKHRVDWTDPNETTIWLAVHY